MFLKIHVDHVQTYKAPCYTLGFTKKNLAKSNEKKILSNVPFMIKISDLK